MTCKNNPCEAEVTKKSKLFCSPSCCSAYHQKKKRRLYKEQKNSFKFIPTHDFSTNCDKDRLFPLSDTVCQNRGINLMELRVSGAKLEHEVIDRRKTRLITLNQIEERVAHYLAKLDNNYKMQFKNGYDRWCECWIVCNKYLEGLK